MEQMHHKKQGEGFCRNLGGSAQISFTKLKNLLDFGWGSAPDPAGAAL